MSWTHGFPLGPKMGAPTSHVRDKSKNIPKLDRLEETGEVGI